MRLKMLPMEGGHFSSIQCITTDAIVYINYKGLSKTLGYLLEGPHSLDQVKHGPTAMNISARKPFVRNDTIR